MSKTILVTTGATETFDTLIRFSLSEVFLSYLAANNFTDLVIQYGTNDSIINKCIESNHNTTEVIQKNDHIVSANINEAAQKTIGTKTKVRFFLHKGITLNPNNSQKQRLRIETYAFNSNLAEDLERAQYIISHSGTGSILDSLRLKKPTLVLVNLNLMDNHQLEIAHVFQEMNLLRYCQLDTVEGKTKFDTRGGVDKNVVGAKQEEDITRGFGRIVEQFEEIVSGKRQFDELAPPNRNALNKVVGDVLGWS